MPITKDHAIIILASGLSQRLGQYKQLLSKNGEPLICYMTKLVVVTQPYTVIVIIPANDPVIVNALAELIIKEPKVHTVVNPVPETGMAHSLSLGIETLTHLNSPSIDRVLIMGIDQVLLDKHHLINLLAGKTPVVASSYQHLNEKFLSESNKENIVGLPLVISYELLKQWQSALIGDKGLRHLIRALPPNQISTVINHQLSYDVDTPDQLAHAQQQSWLD
ncbi:nucleotidyltransferase family protein [Psychrobacter sp. CAL346-MNA-CIBAN-0220]|uniref:nucleotidyltransferase family protein n=1 Tax=Psychrobacter sp. CAL346-MNA-CIBAN-0220 TaxID=3140457 RepID=UPI0033319B25